MTCFKIQLELHQYNDKDDSFIMTNLQMIYYAISPYYIGIICSLLGVTIIPTVHVLLFFHSVNMLNWVCGYHWTLAMQSIQTQTRISSGLLTLMSLWATYTYIEGQQHIAQYLMSVLLVFQLYGDFRSDVTYIISPHVKLARIFSVIGIVYYLLRVM